MATTLPNRIAVYLAALPIIITKKRILVAVSGGIDSMVLVDCLHTLLVDFGIAHVNFQLRGAESDGDEALVASLSARYGVPVYTTSVDTEGYASTKKISIQVAARELRYAWFEQMRVQHHYDYIATAHHLDDNIETVLHHFIKGTGIKGLRGMLPIQGKILRPMLSITRAEIESYCVTHQLTYREDSSNQSTHYTRNQIRRELLPLMEKINPSFQKTMANRLQLFADLESMYERSVAKESKQLFLIRGEAVYIPLLKLRNTLHIRTLLYEYLSVFGFNAAQVDDMLQSIESSPGKQFLSPTHSIVRDRRFFILSAIHHTPQVIYVPEGMMDIKTDTVHLSLTIHDRASITLTADKNIAYLDALKIEYPLVVRSWQTGDYFYPFGMEMKKKKVSKYFKDQKLNLHEKQKVWIVESNRKIAWIVGERIDERYKVTDNTTKILKVNIH